MSGVMWSVIKSSAHRTPMVGCGLYPEVPDPYNDRITSIGAHNRVNFMIKVFVAVLAVLGAWTLMAKLRKLPPHQQRKQLVKYGGWVLRSEERRVGKEWGARRGAYRLISSAP